MEKAIEQETIASIIDFCSSPLISEHNLCDISPVLELRLRQRPSEAPEDCCFTAQELSEERPIPPPKGFHPTTSH